MDTRAKLQARRAFAPGIKALETISRRVEDVRDLLGRQQQLLAEARATASSSSSGGTRFPRKKPQARKLGRRFNDKFLEV